MKIWMKDLLRQNGICYLVGCLYILGMRFWYGKASLEHLKWILAPTAWWAGILSKVSFSYDPRMGYVSHAWHFVIAPSCSGVRFLIISGAMLLFTYVHRIRTVKGKMVWCACSLGTAYLSTVFFNGLRIAASLHLPYRAKAAGLSGGWLTPERRHTLTGVAVYVTALLLLGLAAEIISGKLMARREKTSQRSGIQSRCLSPVLWYLLFVLVLPLPGRLLDHAWKGFGEYALLVTGGCLPVWLLGKAVLLLGRGCGACGKRLRGR